MYNLATLQAHPGQMCIKVHHLTHFYPIKVSEAHLARRCGAYDVSRPDHGSGVCSATNSNTRSYISLPASVMFSPICR